MNVHKSEQASKSITALYVYILYAIIERLKIQAIAPLWWRHKKRCRPENKSWFHCFMQFFLQSIVIWLYMVLLLICVEFHFSSRLNCIKTVNHKRFELIWLVFFAAFALVRFGLQSAQSISFIEIDCIHFDLVFALSKLKFSIFEIIWYWWGEQKPKSKWQWFRPLTIFCDIECFIVCTNDQLSTIIKEHIVGECLKCIFTSFIIFYYH